MTKEEIEFAKLYSENKKLAIESISICYHPECNEKSINSHLLQKNGILSSIAPDRHLWELEINNFKNPQFQFKKTGINQVYSFNCFCNRHDTLLFTKIENQKIDFSDYESCLLFALRTVYNEIWRKEVNVKMYQLLIEKRPDKFDNPFLHGLMEQEELGIKDLRLSESDIWNDLNTKSKSYVFEHRKIPNLDICLSSFFNYDTTKEMNNYILKYGRDMERVSEIFINIFPYNKESHLLMGYNTKDEEKVKGYFYTYFKESLKRVQRKLTNLMLFQCETWVISENLFKTKVKGNEDLFASAVSFSVQNPNERQTFDIDIYKNNFIDKFKAWNNKYAPK